MISDLFFVNSSLELRSINVIHENGEGIKLSTSRVFGRTVMLRKE